MKPGSKFPMWMMVAGWIVALITGLSALGLSIPVFDLESKSHARGTYATKVEVKDMRVMLMEVRDNVIRLLERQGVTPVKRKGR